VGHEASGDAPDTPQPPERQMDSGTTAAVALLAWQRGAGTSTGAAMWLMVKMT